MMPNMDLLAKDLGTVATFLAVMAGGWLLSFVVGATLYILQALGIYTIAVRRCIRHPWMAWLPVANMWVLGSISDQYRYVAMGQIRNRRKLLLGLSIADLAVSLALGGGAVVLIIKLILQIPEFLTSAPQQVMTQMMAPLLCVMGFGVIGWVLMVLAAVFQYVSVYDLYASCIPDYKVLFLVLSILFPVAMPILVFVCRNKDFGMPPRKDAVVEEQPVLTEE